MADPTHHVIAQASAVTVPNRTLNRPVTVPADRPGIVFFIHGVNDTGGNYPRVEQGLCAGLNERLSRGDLRAGLYGAQFAAAGKSKAKPGDDDYPAVAAVKYDPDTYEYRRSEVTAGATPTHSMFIPFYWGYRAAPDEIKGGASNPETLRGQYQDTHGNRLDAHFAKAGGMFNDATADLPSMYDQGFYDSVANKAARATGRFNDYQYSTDSPARRFQVLAAERLAMMIEEIRRVAPDETITLLTHSQGGMVSLLAQALLASRSARCADCLIMTDPPYSVEELWVASVVQPDRPVYTTRSKVNTLVNIITAVTASPHHAPPLEELAPANPAHGGRTGPGWSPTRATWTEADRTTHVFAERDNRGKVYLYFCTEDSTVNLPNIKGIGTVGVPDTVRETWSRSTTTLSRYGMPSESRRDNTVPAMSVLLGLRFHQRLWTKHPKDDDGKPTLVGQAPGYWRIDDNRRHVNGEALAPPYAANLYGGEVIKGDEDTKGCLKPDAYNQDLAIGNPDAKLQWHPITLQQLPPALQQQGPEAVKAWYNGARPDPQNHTYDIRAESYNGQVLRYLREESPNEARLRIRTNADHKAWQQNTNSYHSAILGDANNLRRVAAFDVAIGQAKTLDDPYWRTLFIGLADWKLDKAARNSIKSNPNYGRLSDRARSFVEAGFGYYMKGSFPTALVSTAPPKHYVDTETQAERREKRS